MKEFTVCTTCEVQHFNNCPSCFGFGVLGFTMPSKAPVTAHTAELFRAGRQPFNMMNAFSCPTCHSTPSGVPGTKLALIPHPTQFGRAHRRPLVADRQYAERLAIAFCDGAYVALDQMFSTWEHSTVMSLYRRAVPYERLRDFLRFDEGIEPTLACAVALRFTTVRTT